MLPGTTGSAQPARVTDRVVAPRSPVTPTARRTATGQDRDTDGIFDDVFDHLPTGMLLADLSSTRPGRLVRVNAALCRMTGYSRRQLLAMSLVDLVHPDHLAAHRRRFAEVLSGRRTHGAVQRRWRRADGHEIWVQFNVTTVDTDGIGTHLVGMVDDITARVLLERRLRTQDRQDPLTGLPAHQLFVERVAHALDAARSSRHRIAVLRIAPVDLEHCRDVAGPADADELLVQAARRLVDNVRPGDTVGRTGVSDFLVLCPAFVPSDDAAAVVVGRLTGFVERLRETLAAPYQVGGVVHHLAFRIVQTTSVAGQHVEDLLRVLGRPPAPASAAFRSTIVGTCAPTFLGREAAARHIELENDLRRALAGDELVMFGQPIISMRSGQIDAVEMLVRWRHPERGLLGPADFLDVAEAGPLMEELGRRVLRESCRIAAGWRAAPGVPLPSVFVNVSGRQLESGRLPAEVFAALHASGLPADRLVLKLTETCAPLFSGGILADLAMLRERGIRLAVDDVGTGYSTLARLAELPVDLLKIDRSFIVGMGSPGSADAIVRAIMGIGRSLGVPVVAEGIETPDQAAAVGGHGCDLAQGFFFGRPCPETELSSLVRPPGPPRDPSCR